MSARTRLAALLLIGMAATGCSDDSEIAGVQTAGGRLSETTTSTSASTSTSAATSTSTSSTATTTTVVEEASADEAGEAPADVPPAGEAAAAGTPAGGGDPVTEQIESQFTAAGLDPTPELVACARDRGFDPGSADAQELAVTVCSFEEVIRTNPTMLPALPPLDQAGMNCMVTQNLRYLSTMPADQALDLLDTGLDYAVGYVSIPNAAALESNCGISGDTLTALFASAG